MTIASTSSALRLSKLAPSIVQSEIRAMTIACNAIDGINMSQGVCDTDPPHPVIEGAVNAMHVASMAPVVPVVTRISPSGSAVMAL